LRLGVDLWPAMSSGREAAGKWNGIYSWISRLLSQYSRTLNLLFTYQLTMNATYSEIGATKTDIGARVPPVRYRLRPLATIWEAFRIAADSIWSHKLRSVLTLLGIIIGVASVVAVGGAIEGLGYYVRDRLTSTFGSNTFMVARMARVNRSQDEYEKIIKRNKRLYLDDMRAVEARCEDCAAISTNLGRTADAKAGNRTFFDANIRGVSEDAPKIQELIVAEGRFISSFDTQHARQVAVIGDAIRKELFGPVDVMGKQIRIGTDSFNVIGVEQENGTFFGQSLDNNIYIPYTSFMKIFSVRSLSFQVKAPDAETLVSTEDQVRVALRTRHKLHPNQEDDFDILSSDAIQNAVGQFTGTIAVVVVPITCISLVVGGIVVMNIMLVTVTERSPEIGMRKAIGARRRDILLQFLIESSLLASLGGFLGLALAYGIAIVIRATTPIPMAITIFYAALAIVTSGGIGLIAGCYPAIRAARLDPIVALARE
jgi:putative ABC transport system permease protein